MRKLIIKRNNSIVSQNTKTVFFITDPDSNTIINGKNARKLGELSNGEAADFEISDEEARVFAQKSGKDFRSCREFIDISAGNTDVFLSGKSFFNPFSGNSFRFDNNFTPDAIHNRNQADKKGITVIIIGLITALFAVALFRYFVIKPLNEIAATNFVGSIIELFNSSKKTFSKNEFSITLTREFEEDSDPDLFSLYVSEDVTVLVAKEQFENDSSDYTLKSYAEELKQRMGTGVEKIIEKDGLIYFETTIYDAETGVNLQLLFSFYQSAENEFCFVAFSTKPSDMDEYRDDIIKWAKTVKFDK